jgi:hypothetical protein
VTSTKETFTRSGLTALGFGGFQSVGRLRASSLSSAPDGGGVYAVLRESDDPPQFLTRSTGGWFKRKDPTVPVSVLRSKWVDDAVVLYIGKADAGRSGRRGLRKRLSELLDFGAGRPIGHKGGRYLWQVGGSSEFVVCWREDPTPRASETALLAEFKGAHDGTRPFANLIG